MSCLVYIESDGEKIKKSSLEAVLYASKMNVGPVTAVIADPASDEELTALGKYGASKVLKSTDDRLKSGVVLATASLIKAAVEQTDAQYIIMPRSSLVDAAAPRAAVKIGATVATNVVALPESSEPLTVKRGIYTGKAFATVSLPANGKAILTLAKNAVILEATEGTASIETMEANIPESDFETKKTGEEKATGDILLPEAERVISGGRGLKGPENWKMVEDLAKALKAGTACSKPVSDMEWRPHHEHVGQTGIKVSPSLYIAAGISGAIQHLAGVNSSKVIVVINKDAEAPFFKSADYGVVGDVFEVLPKLTEAVKRQMN